MLEERGRILIFEYFRLDPVEIDLHLVGNAAVGQRLDQRFIGIFHAGVFANDRNRDVAFRIPNALVDQTPAFEIRALTRLDPECSEHLGIETFGE